MIRERKETCTWMPRTRIRRMYLLMESWPADKFVEVTMELKSIKQKIPKLLAAGLKMKKAYSYGLPTE